MLCRRRDVRAELVHTSAAPLSFMSHNFRKEKILLPTPETRTTERARRLKSIGNSPPSLPHFHSRCSTSNSTSTKWILAQCTWSFMSETARPCTYSLSFSLFAPILFYKMSILHSYTTACPLPVYRSLGAGMICTRLAQVRKLRLSLYSLSHHFSLAHCAPTNDFGTIDLPC